MSLTDSAPTGAPDFIKQRLKTSKITHAAIIDDVFDGVPNEALETGMDSFIMAISDDTDLFGEVQKFCNGLKEAEDFDLECGRQLWSGRDQWNEALRPHAQLLFNVYQQRFDTLLRLADNLGQLGLEVHRLGTREAVPAGVPLVFLDYCLQPERDAQVLVLKQEELAESGATQVKQEPGLLAVQIAGQLANLGAQRPFLVLISDRAELTQVRAEFRRRTDYLASTFACLSKAQASDHESLYIQLGCWGVGQPALLAIHEFFDAVMGSLKTTTEEFRQALLELDAQDYSFIQRLSLADDGEPLGEYMLNLIAAAISYRLREQPAVRAARMALDGQRFSEHLPSSAQPSPQVRRLYQQVLTDPSVEDLAPHPLQHLQSPQVSASMPRLALGDIFANSDHRVVFMVVNPACDLQFSPINPKRVADPTLPIYLIPGHLEAFNHSADSKATARTEIFELDGLAFRVLWDQKHVVTVLLREFEAWCLSGGYRRVTRLGLVHALAVQHTWTADLSRVGVPVTPPLTNPGDFRMFLRDADGKLEPFGERVRGQVILGRFRRKDELVDCFILTVDAVSDLRDALENAARRFQEFAVTVPAGPYQAGKSGALQKLAQQAQTAKGAIDYWYGLLEREQELKRVDGTKWSPEEHLKNPLAFWWQAYPGGKPIKQFGGGEIVLVVDILAPEVSDNGPVPPAEKQANESLVAPEAAGESPPSSEAPIGDKFAVEPDK